MTYEIEYNYGQVAGQIKNIWPVFLSRSEEMMTVIGETALSFIIEDYRDKSQGRQGKDGISWPDITESAARSRLQKRNARYRKLKRISPVKGESENQRKARVEKNKKIIQKKKAMVSETLGTADILVDTQKMIGALTPYAKGTGFENVFTASGFVVTIGVKRKGGRSGINIAGIHNEGENHIPARPFITEANLAPPERREELVLTVEEFIDLSLKENGF